MLTSPNQTVNVTGTASTKTINMVPVKELTPAEKSFQEQRMRDVLMLLEDLSRREETTIKLIIDCLYDVGSINFVNKKIPNNIVNPLVKAIVNLSKPVFKIFIWRWFKSKVPLKITNWLYNKVKFK
jgi:hypothetical protein